MYIHSKTGSCLCNGHQPIPKWTFQINTNLHVPVGYYNSLGGFSLFTLGIICEFVNFYQMLSIQLLTSNILFHINHYFSFSFQSYRRPWCFSFANGYPEAAWCTALSFSPSISKHFFLGLSCVECSLTKPIWLHPDMQRSYPPVGAVYINEDSVTPQGVSQWVLFLQKKKEKNSIFLCRLVLKVSRLANRFWWILFPPCPHAWSKNNSTT